MDDDYTEYAIEMLFEYPIPYLDETKYGFLDFFTSTAGYLSEGLTYFSPNVYDDIDLFMTAYLRTTGINLYNSDLVTNTMYKTINMIKPDMSLLTLDDSYSHLYSQSDSRNFAAEIFVTGFYDFYYNNTIGGELDQQIRWYFSQWMDRYDNYDGPPLIHWSTYFRPVYSYNPNKTTSIFSEPETVPEIITNGTWSDEELTVFRSSVSDQTEFENSIQMYVNYDNSLDPSYHEHGDQTSYQLFAYGKYLLVDPGYKAHDYTNYARNALEWTRSPYAHSLVIVNPDSLKEYLNLAHHYNGDSTVHEDTLMSYYQLRKNEPRFRKLVDPNLDKPVPMKRRLSPTNSLSKLPAHQEGAK
ncbi:MAG: heparinase II/III-family protein [Candidatus Cloacimonetes bacterium]|nr:heparinase II/III-family protein [Candidatus Cloacimonadota bacterium]